MANTAVNSILNQIYLQLDIESEGIPQTPNLITTISIHENISSATPVMQFTFDDLQSSLVRKLALTEATRIKVLVGKYKESALPYKFRLFGFRQTASREGPKLHANFILDAPKYITASYTESFKGTSDSVLSDLASKSGLSYSGTITSDEQVWLNFGQTRAAFAEDIAMHGYNNESSCMIRALTAEHELRYKDVMKELNSTQPKKSLSLNSNEKQGAIYVRDMRDVSVSGLMNNYLNYGWKYPEHSLSGDEKLNNEYDVQTTEAYLPINSDVKETVEKARLEYCRKLDCRNTHKNYNKAYYINLRGRALLSTKIHVLVEEPTQLNVLDIVDFYHTTNDKQSGKATGKYIVTAKVIYIVNGSAYYEKLELARCSLREAGNTPLVG